MARTKDTTHKKGGNKKKVTTTTSKKKDPTPIPNNGTRKLRSAGPLSQIPAGNFAPSRKLPPVFSQLDSDNDNDDNFSNCSTRPSIQIPGQKDYAADPNDDDIHTVLPLLTAAQNI
jgi:hypothetical protein